MTQSMIPAPGPVGTVVWWPKNGFMGMGGSGYKKRASIVVELRNGNEAVLEPWCRPSRGWARHVRRRKAAR